MTIKKKRVNISPELDDYSSAKEYAIFADVVLS